MDEVKTYGKRILIIDDEPSLRSLVESFLLQAGYQTESTSNCKLGLQRIQSGSIFDLIICDLKTPVMMGDQFIAQLRAMGDNTKIILLSAFIDKQTILKTQGLSVTKYLTKPIKPNQLLEVVKQLLPLDQ